MYNLHHYPVLHFNIPKGYLLLICSQSPVHLLATTNLLYGHSIKNGNTEYASYDIWSFVSSIFLEDYPYCRIWIVHSFLLLNIFQVYVTSDAKQPINNGVLFQKEVKKKNELSKTSHCIFPTTATIILKSKSDQFLQYYYLFNDYHQPLRQSPSSLEEHTRYRPCQSVHFDFLRLFSQTLCQLSKLR